MTGKEKQQKKCFVIMPITTPDHLVETYDGDLNHFEHILEYLFQPAIEEAGLETVSPIAKGSEQINSRIIQNIEKADLVLCDMSILNANVFFELGIRTALNKPVCIVKDDKLPSKNVPFDIATINHHTYQGSIQLWNRDKEKRRLCKHIQDSIDQSKENELWKHFSMSASAHSLEKAGADDKMDYLVNIVEAMRAERKIDPTEIVWDFTDQGVMANLGEASSSSQLELYSTKINSETIQKLVMALITDFRKAANIKRNDIEEHLEEIKGYIRFQLMNQYRYNEIQATKIIKRYFNQALKLSLTYNSID